MTIIKSALTVDQALGLIWTMASDPYEVGAVIYLFIHSTVIY